MTLEETETLTAIDFLEQQQRLLDEAVEALPHAIDRCSFAQGAVTQPVYSCTTCAPGDSKPVGVCYACFVQCHTTHNVVELGERRNFICDCGSLRMDASDSKCTLQTKSVGAINASNTYTPAHVFSGLFCYCKSLYNPDTELPDSFMLQCLFCENWFHSDPCIKNCPDEDAFDEFVCRDCVGTHWFLALYIDSDSKRSKYLEFVSENEMPTQEKSTIAATPILTVVEDADNHESFHERQYVNDDDESPITPGKSKRKKKTETATTPRYILHSAKKSKTDAPATLALSSDILEICKLAKPIASLSEPIISSPSHLYCFDGWRLQLCRCNECMNHYRTNNILFLLETKPIITQSSLGTTDALQPRVSTTAPTTTSSTILRPDTEAHISLLDAGMSALNKIPRVKAIEGVLAYEKLADFAKEFFKKFADEGKVVTKEDVAEMFAELKKQRDEALEDEQRDGFL